MGEIKSWGTQRGENTDRERQSQPQGFTWLCPGQVWASQGLIQLQMSAAETKKANTTSCKNSCTLTYICYASYCLKHFLCIHSFNGHNPLWIRSLLPLFTQIRNWGSERLTKWPPLSQRQHWNLNSNCLGSQPRLLRLSNAVLIDNIKQVRANQQFRWSISQCWDLNPQKD